MIRHVQASQEAVGRLALLGLLQQPLRTFSRRRFADHRYDGSSRTDAGVPFRINGRRVVQLPLERHGAQAVHFFRPTTRVQFDGFGPNLGALRRE